VYLSVCVTLVYCVSVLKQIELIVGVRIIVWGA